MLFSKYFLFFVSLETFVNYCFSLSLPQTNYCRCHCTWSQYYPNSKVERFFVPDDKVQWSKVYQKYNPPDYTSHDLSKKSYADPNIAHLCIGAQGFRPLWHKQDVNNSRISTEGKYQIINGYPQNAIGRTGIKGRGKLGRWGPNHVANSVVSTWKRDAADMIVLNPTSLRPVLKFIAIKGNRSNITWEFPGGFVNPGESTNYAAIREFKEEALNSLGTSKEKAHQLDTDFQDFFNKGKIIIRIYMNDQRNTDNAWVESTVYHFHDESGDIVERLPLDAGDDANEVQWLDASKKMNLYGCHRDIMFLITEMLNAHW